MAMPWIPDPSGPPSGSDLKRRLLDANRRHFPSDVLNCAAHMILSVDQPDAMASLALEFLVEKLHASRADFGFGTPQDRFYRPSAVFYSSTGGAPMSCATIYPNRAAVFRSAWSQAQPVSCDDIASHPALADCRATFEAIQTRAILFHRLLDSSRPVGLISIDFTDGTHVWRDSERALVHDICTIFLAPLAATAQRWHALGAQARDAARPSPAELDAIRLVARGQSVKQIARELGKSANTIENQLRNARSRMNAANTGALVHRCAPWL